MSIQAVFFDMGGTIETFAHDPQMRLLVTPELNSLLCSFTIDLHLDTSNLYQLISTGLKAYHNEAVATEDEIPAVEVWKKYILPTYPQFFAALDTHGEELMYWLDTNYFHRKLRPEVPAVLTDLKEMGLFIGLISNICSRNQVPDNLQKYGIADYFSVVITSADFGRRKPDPSIFRHAAYMAGVPTSKCAYVGDRVIRDIIGARRAGYKLAVQIIHTFNHGEPDDGAVPDAVIQNMGELIEIIKTENNKPEQTQAASNPIKALLFDAGDILYLRPNRGKALKQFLAEIGLALNPEREAVRTDIKLRAYRGEISRDQYFTEMITSYGVSQPDHIRGGKIILAEADDNIQFFDGVCETLQALKSRGYMLGIITDTAVPAYVKMKWFENGGFGEVWDCYISSREIGYEKPDPRIYHAAMKQLGLKPEETFFVGHSPEELVGATAVGMHTITFNPDDGAVAEHTADTFTDILKIVENYRLYREDRHGKPCD
jgi:HAD superfamily hydrolase (TIGR01509 family)